MHNLAPNIPSLFHLYDIYTIHLAFFSFIIKNGNKYTVFFYSTNSVF